MKKFLISLLVLLVIGWSIIAVIFIDLQTYSKTAAVENAPLQAIIIKPGERFHEIVNILHERGIIRQPLKFKLLSRVYGHDKRIQAGDYKLSGSMSPLEVLDTLIKGKVALKKITIPEGYSMAQIAELVEQNGLGKAGEFLQRATNPEYVSAKGINADTLEGYLFPDTYFFSRNAGIDTIITTMLNQFNRVLTQEWRERAATMGFSVHEIVTLASIVEKETGLAEERPLVASVFHNRLKKNMRLDSDPTVIYGIADFTGKLTRTHLRTETPYNTYRIKGMPPGPIANPGKAALEAVLFPADTDFLFFVSRNDSSHQFSTNLNDHNRAVMKYQRGQRRQSNE